MRSQTEITRDNLGAAALNLANKTGKEYVVYRNAKRRRLEIGERVDLEPEDDVLDTYTRRA